MARRNRRNRKSKKAANKTASQKPSVDVAEKKNTDKAQDEVVECKAVAVIDSEAATEDTTTEETAAYSEASQRVAAAFEKVGQLISEPEPEPQPETQSVPSEVSDWQQVLESSLRDSNRKLQDQFTKVTKSFESRIEFLLDELADRSAAAKADQTESDTTTEPTAANGSVVESDWQRRKREMFAESGEEYEENSQFDTPADRAAKSAAEKAEQDELKSLTEALHDSIESIDEVEAEDIEELRGQLSEKLREAEVELSINRAKLDQRRAELDRRETELERRERSLASKYSEVNGKPQRKGVMDRLTRHLGARKQADQL